MRKLTRTTRNSPRAKLPLQKETIRTLDPSELSDIQTGITCPTTMSTRTTHQIETGEEGQN